MNEDDIKTWMKKHAREYLDSCRELDLTALSEAAAQEFDAYTGDEYEIPYRIFDLAVDVGEELEL